MLQSWPSGKLEHARQAKPPPCTSDRSMRRYSARSKRWTRNWTRPTYGIFFFLLCVPPSSLVPLVFPPVAAGAGFTRLELVCSCCLLRGASLGTGERTLRLLPPLPPLWSAGPPAGGAYRAPGPSLAGRPRVRAAAWRLLAASFASVAVARCGAEEVGPDGTGLAPSR